MVTAATSAAPAAPKNGNGSKKPIATVPFIRASMPWYQPTNIDVTKLQTGSTQSLGSFDIPSNGFVRAIVIKVTTSSAGTGGSPSVTLGENAPFNLIKNIQFKEPGGQTIGQWDDGWDLYQACKWGGYQNVIGADPRTKKSYSQFASTYASGGFMLRVPVELNGRHGLGSLANQNAASTLRLEASLAANTDVGTGTFPTTLPTFRFQVFLELWGQPAGSADGMSNQTTPPVAGTTQFWTTQYYPVNAGQQSIKLNRVGNYIRNLHFTFTRTGGTRANGQSDWPTQTEIYYDTYTPITLDKAHWTDLMTEWSGYGATHGTEVPAYDAPGGLDNGVFILPFTTEFNGTLGFENNDLWLPSKTSSRIEIRGNFANAGTLKVQTNDVAPTGPVWG